MRHLAVLACWLYLRYQQPVNLWPFDVESCVRVTCAVGYLCANFGLSRPLFSRLRPDIQTDRRQTKAWLNTPLLWRDIIMRLCDLLLADYARHRECLKVAAESASVASCAQTLTDVYDDVSSPARYRPELHSQHSPAVTCA